MMPRSPTADELRRTHAVEIEARSQGSTRRGEVTVVRRVACECALDRLWAQGHLGRATEADAAERRWRAGMMFRARWRSATRPPRIVADLLGTGGGNVAEAIVSRHAAADAVTDAIKAMGHLGSAAVIAVAGQDEAARGRLGALLLGLDALAGHWRVEVAEKKA